MTKAIKYTIDQDSGFLHATAICARNGVQEYMGSELGLSGEQANRVFQVFRPLDEVASSLSTYTNAIVTDDHPTDGLVTTETSSELSKGSVSNAEIIEYDGISYISATITITNKELIYKVLSGEKRELSAGYTSDIVKESGEFDGVSYQYVQKDIKVNHVAVVTEGRCGNTCKLNLDNKGVIKMVKIQIDGKAVSMDADEVAKYVTELETSLDEAIVEVKKAKKEVDEMTSSKEELSTAITAKEAELEELKKQLETMLTPEEAADMAEESMEIEEDAKSLDIETKEKSCDAKRREILAVVGKGKVNLDSLDKDALKAVYRISVDNAIEAKKAQKAGYMGTNSRGVVVRTGNLSNDLNSIAKEARKNRGAK